MDDPGGTEADLADRLVATERARLRARVEADMATADALHADDYQLITPGGSTLSKAEYLAGISDGTLSYRRFEPEGELAVRAWEGVRPCATR